MLCRMGCEISLVARAKIEEPVDLPQPDRDLPEWVGRLDPEHALSDSHPSSYGGISPEGDLMGYVMCPKACAECRRPEQGCPGVRITAQSEHLQG